MIHFQWDQEGATLRASELKPKLDKYIEKIKEYYPEGVLLKNGISVDDKVAGKIFGYRLAISQASIKEKTIPKILDKKTKNSGEYNTVENINSNPIAKQKMVRSLYFGNVKAMLEYNNDLVLKFQSFDTEMLKRICLALPIMLAMENFGSRQNKGFGSFYVSDDTKALSDSFCQSISLKIEDIYKAYVNNTVYYFDCNGNYVEVFKQIFYFYNSLKAGINEPGKYFKSLLWKYFREKNHNLIWEKRIMKQVLIKDELPSSLNDDYKFIRILLGLSPTYEFKSTVQEKTKLDQPVRMDNDYGDIRTLSIPGKVTFNVYDLETNDELKIERITSPITFKPIKTQNGYRVYIILKPETINGISNHEFAFKKNSDPDVCFAIRPPNDFKLEDFMDFAIKQMKYNVTKIQRSA